MASEPQGAETPSPDYGWAGADFVENGALKPTFAEHYQNLLAEKTARDEQLAGVPADGRYAFEPPTEIDFGDIKLPEGVKIEVKKDDPEFAPLFDALGQFLHGQKLPQSAATEVMGLLTKYEAAKYSRAHEAAVKEYEALGPSDAARDARVNRTLRALQTRFPADQVKAVEGMVRSAPAIKLIESLLFPGGVNAPPSVPKPPEDDPVARRYANSPKL